MPVKEKRKRGRPEGQIYPERLIFRFPEGTAAKLDSLAEQKSMTRAEYVRTLIERAVKRG